MKIKVTSVYVDDQDKALRFYTEVLGFAKKTDFSQGPYRWLTVASPEEPDGTELQLALNNNPAAKDVSAGDVSTEPACDDVLHRRHQGRLRADQGPRRRVHYAAHRRDRLDHCDAEGHLRQPHSAHAAEALVRLESGWTAITSAIAVPDSFPHLRLFLAQTKAGHCVFELRRSGGQRVLKVAKSKPMMNDPVQLILWYPSVRTLT